MFDKNQLQDIQGATVLDQTGDKVGTADDIYLDSDTGQPEWVLVNTGFFGSKSTFIPLREAGIEGSDITVPYDKDHIKAAPNIDPEGSLSQEEEQSLYRHYGLPYSEERSETGLPDEGERRPEGYDVSGRTTDDAMTRSEEEMRVGKTTRERGRARLRKYVVTEDVQTTVPVQREEVRVEREPVTEGNVDRAMTGPDISEEEHEVVLHEEEPVVEKRAVPKERVRITKDTATEQEQVTGEVRKERIEEEGDIRR